MKETIQDASGRVIGYKKTVGNQVIVESPTGKMLGRYDGNTEKTFDKSGRAMYNGDQTSALFER